MLPTNHLENSLGPGLSSTRAATASRPVCDPPHMPDHEVLNPIASGAYGEVWLTRNAVGTLRAVKIVRRDQHSAAESFEREFKGLQKFEPISRTHEGLVDILTLGLLPDGAGFYYVMELADDANVGQASRLSVANGNSKAETGATSVLLYTPRTLRAELKTRGAFPADEVIALGLKLTAALAHLHAHGLVHRDVKPSNILFIGGEPKLADAGLVAAVDDAVSLVGTVGYIAPEGPGTPQADLYALGKVLYEAAFGKDRQEFPKLPADVASLPDHARLLEINAILLKACATTACERYLSAEAILSELKLLERGESVRRKRAITHRWKIVRNSSLTLLVLAVAGVGATVVLRELKRDQSLSSNPEALIHYTHAKHLLNQQTLERHLEAYSLLTNAVSRDPRFIDAYYLLWESYSPHGGWGDRLPPYTNTMRNFQWALEKMRELNPNSAQYHTAVGWLEYLKWNWNKAIDHYELALKANSKFVRAHGVYAGVMLRARGDDETALREFKAAERLDPNDSIIQIHLGTPYYFRRDYANAIAQFQKAAVLERSAGYTFWWLGLAYEGNHQYEEALVAYEKHEKSLPDANATQVEARYRQWRAVLAEKGLHELWQAMLDHHQRYWPDAFAMAGLHARLGHHREALDLLDKAFQDHHENLPDLLLYHFWAAFYDEPRFEDLVRKLGFPSAALERQKIWRDARAKESPVQRETAR